MMRGILIAAAGAVVAALIVAAAEGIFGALSSLLGPSVPPGAVVAFEADKCPDGWKLYHSGAGRFLFGADGDHDLRSEGGQEKHVLTWDEMPMHRHDDDNGNLLLVQKSHDITATEIDNVGRDEINIRHGVRMKISGGNMPHENMPPYRVVNFCEKK
jgi:hypothetical protein